MKFAGIIFDFDGVLVESEYAGNRHLAEYLTRIGHAHTPAEAMQHYMGLSGRAFIDAIEGRIGTALPEGFFAERDVENQRVLAEGVGEVAGAVAFVRSLPAEFPRAIASSSTTHWIRTHLRHLGLEAAFGEHVYSGKEHVTRGKPAPDLYLHAAAAIGVAISDCVILEDSPVGATGAVASGAHVIGLCAGTHCPPDHARVLKAIGVHDIAADFGEVARLVGL
jgi:beta-phosphoglucomutase-like phosphatase (HAD superfamily)